jgi:hypothetical protein
VTDADELHSGDRESFFGARNASVETDMMGHPPDQGWEATASSPNTGTHPRFPFPVSVPNPHPQPSAPLQISSSAPLALLRLYAVVFVHLPPIHLVLAFSLIPEDLDASSIGSMAHPEFNFIFSILMTNFQVMWASTLSLV